MADDNRRGRIDKPRRPQGQARGGLKQRLRTARGRKLSSARWLERQLNDPYVAAAKRAGYRSRAAFKLAELDDRFGFLRPGGRVVDLGAAPGGWTQVAVKRVGAIEEEGPLVLAVDVQDMEPVPGAAFLKLDFMAPGAAEQVRGAVHGPVDVVLSDMAAAATGHRQTDHLRIIALCEAAFDFAAEVLRPGGTFVAKVLQGGSERALLLRMKAAFRSVRHVKPKASRAESAEMYVVAQGYHGAASSETG